MLIAKIQNGQVIDVADYRSMFPDTSFPSSGPDSSFMSANGCLYVNTWKEYNPLTEKLVSASPYIEGEWVYTIVVEPLLQEEIDINTEIQWKKIRTQRDALLQSSDWTQLSDVPLDAETKQLWVVYRQQLRDVTSQTDPYNIVWPTIVPNA